MTRVPPGYRHFARRDDERKPEPPTPAAPIRAALARVRRRGGTLHRAPREPQAPSVAIPIYLAVATAPIDGLPRSWLAFVVVRRASGSAGGPRASSAVHDHPGIVLDEIAGFLVTMTALPFEWPWIVAGFVAFRVFDVAKPWPISLADRKVGGGLGIMLDDVIAGALACAALHAVRYAIGA